MKKISFTEIETGDFIQMPKEALKQIEGGCTFYKHYDACNGKFLHNRRVFCGVMHLNVRNQYKVSYHNKNATCMGYSW